MKYIERCLNCKFMLDFGCKAYPEGIRDDFAQGYKKHTKIEKDQEGDFVFTPIDDYEDLTS